MRKNTIGFINLYGLININYHKSKVGADFIIQINNPNDPVANGFLNKDGNYDIKYGLFDDLEFHKFENYFPNIKLYIQNKGIIKNE
ncbi:hypothetical protein [Campylobacter sputorum]|uniref:hypothetical protein n=1 Tax=Campylobacter sputorum TaxID=206 RepID=UPI00187AA68B|nr:hypothetical protein [Campylobacter sp. RM11302]MBE7358885.1 hypothetical protein [Campylobacter sp. RM11302]